MHVRFSGFAEADLDSIYTYIANDNSAAAQRVIDALLMAAFQLEAFPFLGRHGRVKDTRELTVPGTSYFLVYSLPDDFNIDIERVLHSRMQYPTAQD